MKRRSVAGSVAVTILGMVFGPDGACRAGTAAPAIATRVGDDVAVNGDFRRGFDGWARFGKAAVDTVDGRPTLAVATPDTKAAEQKIPVGTNWYAVKLKLRLRALGVETGREPWMDARLATSFVGRDGKALAERLDIAHATGTTGWLDCERTYLVPEGAVQLVIAPGNWGKTGRAEFQLIRIELAELRSPRTDLPVPAGVEAPWDPAKAWRQRSATRESICLNGLWRFMPARAGTNTAVPAPGAGWGWFKVPGMWPGSTSWNVGEAAQRPLLPAWMVQGPARIPLRDLAWYKRTFQVPAAWKGRKVLLDFGLVQTQARVLLDGRPAGEVWFPGGVLDISDHVSWGTEQELAVLLTACPLAPESNVFMAPDRIIKSQASVRMKGLTGDVYLRSEPRANAVDDVRVETSVRRGRIAFDVGLSRLSAQRLAVAVAVCKAGKSVRTFAFAPVAVSGTNTRVTVAADWKNPERWDLDTPQNMYEAVLTLTDAGSGARLDETLPFRFGFREFWIDGKDFRLNGSTVHLRSLCLENLTDYADRACRAGARSTLRKMAAFGFNAFIPVNYNFKPGEVGYLDSLFEAADETGMLCSFSLPHVWDFDMHLDDPAVAARYRALCDYLIRKVQNHPSIVLYAMNHNAMGYHGDQNPLKLDGLWNPEGLENVPADFLAKRQQAMRAAGIANALDPSRPVYHHESGNLGTMHTANTYLNWAPRQERSDWLEHWAAKGVKPLFFVEWGMPHYASWSSYRGPHFIWSSAEFQQVWDSEFAAPCIGERAYVMTPEKVALLQEEERLWALKQTFHFQSNYVRPLATTHDDVVAWYMSDNWRALRLWGISAIVPWDADSFWHRVAPAGRVENPDAFRDLQRPGIVPDFFSPGRQFLMDPRDDAFEPTSSGRVMQRWNQPLMAFIAGAPTFTDKAHTFTPGEKVAKQLALLNDSRRERTCVYRWSVKGTALAAAGRVRLPPGETAFVPVAFDMPAGAPRQTLAAEFEFDDGTPLADEFALDAVRAESPPRAWRNTIALFDPKGLTARLLAEAAIPFTRIDSLARAADFGVLVIGREALAAAPGACLDLRAAAGGAKVLVFEQDYDTLTQRLGFRATERGVRHVFARVPSHPILAGLPADSLCDWRGASTLVSPYLDLPAFEMQDPPWNWCGFDNKRVWRCGCRNAVASVVIEKPERGNWLPLLDGGFDLQYSPLLEYQGPEGRLVFCQMDVSGRTAPEPAAVQLCRNLLAYLDRAPAPIFRPVVYDGDARGARLLDQLGVPFSRCTTAAIPAGSVLVLGPAPAIVKALRAPLDKDLHVVGFGLGTKDLETLLAGRVEAVERETVSTTDTNLAGAGELRGVSNAELHWMTFPRIAALKPSPEGDHPALRVLTCGDNRVVLCQAAPWDFDDAAKPYLRTSARRSVFLAARLLANAGAEFRSPLASMFARPGAPRRQALTQGWRTADETGVPDAANRCPRPAFDDHAWTTVSIPNAYTNLGARWYRLTFETPRGFVEDDVTLSLGAIDDESWVWLNGQCLGEVTKANTPKDYWCHPRAYRLPRGLLRVPGPNVVAIRVNNIFMNGGMLGTPSLAAEAPWWHSYYLQAPVADDDPYRYFRW